MYLQKVGKKRKILEINNRGRNMTGSGSASGSISQSCGFADPHPDLYKNFMDPQQPVNTKQS
jgi:hypothetical protein